MKKKLLLLYLVYLGAIVIVFVIPVLMMRMSTDRVPLRHSQDFCIDGVSLHLDGHVLAPVYNKDGTLKTCVSKAWSE